MGIRTFSFKNTTGLCFFRLAFAAGLLLIASLLSANVQRGNCVTIETIPAPRGWGNGTTSTNSAVADEYVMFSHDEDQEFLMDSEFGNLLAGKGSVPHTVYRVLQTKPVCSTVRYGSCISKNGQQLRQCTLQERCQHHV